MNEVSKAYKSILKEYRDDMVKYAPDRDKPHIRECFNSIPKQLAKDNKKFQYNKIKPGGRSETYLGSLQWLEDAGIIGRVGRLLTLPNYMQFLLDLEPEEIVLEPINVEGVNALAKGILTP